MGGLLLIKQSEKGCWDTPFVQKSLKKVVIKEMELIYSHHLILTDDFENII